MKQILLMITLHLAVHAIPAQKPAINKYAIIDKKALQIPDSLTKTTEDIAAYTTSNFSADTEKVRSIFTWITSSIQYDIDNMFAINFYEKTKDKISKALTNRKGICENYAALFNDICLKAGIKSYMIEGYTKQNGFVDYIAHAWCAALIDGSWFLFDPTFGSGYISNGKFYRKINYDYFKVSPAALIKSHMPFDFLWQFLNYPVTNQEFYEGKTQQNKLKPFFSYPDSINAYEQQSFMEQLKATGERIERNGVRSSLIFERLRQIKLQIENDRIETENKRISETANLYNSAVADYNNGINSFNEFIVYRNNQFNPLKTDLEIQNMIDSAYKNVTGAKTKLSAIKKPDANLKILMAQLTKSIDDITSQVREQQDWLKIYFGKNKQGRKSMLAGQRKITLFGIPLN